MHNIMFLKGKSVIAAHNSKT